MSRVCLGTATFGVAPSSQDAHGVVGAALDPDIHAFDTALTTDLPHRPASARS